MTKNVFIMAAALVFAGAQAVAADWPQIQGPNRDGVSSETGLARSWPSEGPAVLWTAALGEGYASPSVRDGQVYILDRVEDKQDVLRCLDLNTGKELWNFGYDAPGTISHNGSRTAPTIDDKNVYCVGMLGDFYCIDRQTHAPVWNKNLAKDFQLEVPGWGIVQAPSIYGDLVIVAPQAQDAYVVAYKKDTGDVAWKSPSLGKLGYSTPVVKTLAGVDQAIMVGACQKGGGFPGKVAGIALDDGRILWSYEGFQCHIPIPYATVLPDDRLFITGGYGAGSAMIQVKRDGEGFVVKELFKTDKCGSQIQQPVFFKDHLFVGSNSNEREDGLMCLAMDGTIKWQTGGGFFATTFEHGPLLLADGLIYILDGKKGILHLVEPSAEEFKELAQARVLSGKEIWAPMALSDGKLLVRSQQELKCLAVK